jgi:hypothetical protein
MTNCPKCGAPLSISITLETDYSKTKQILQAKASGADLTNEQLDCLKWKTSQKKPALSTLLVTPDLLSVPLAKLLYDRLLSSATKSWKLSETTYKLSTLADGSAQFLQRWTSVKGGSN